jgi:hypothetical protein
MKNDILARAVGGIDDALIEGAAAHPAAGRRRSLLLRWGTAAAALALVLGVVLAVPAVRKKIFSAPAAEYEFAAVRVYQYTVDSGQFSSYVPGRVIADGMVGEKIADVTVSAGWFGAQGERLTEEHARAEIYEIIGVPTGTAAALRFLDEVEAETTTRFYVILNPEADLSCVAEYVIPRETPADGGEVPE